MDSAVWPYAGTVHYISLDCDVAVVVVAWHYLFFKKNPRSRTMLESDQKLYGLAALPPALLSRDFATNAATLYIVV